MDTMKINKFPIPDETSVFDGKLSPKIRLLSASVSNDSKSEVTSKPFPKTCGNDKAINPTQSPPSAVLNGIGTLSNFSILSSPIIIPKTM